MEVSAASDLQEASARAISRLSAAIVNRAMYAEDHPQVAIHTREAFKELQGLLRSRSQVTFLLFGGNLIVDNRPLILPGSHGNAFIQILQRKAVGKITFIEGIGFAQLALFINELASSTLSVHAATHIRIGKVGIMDTGTEKDQDAPEEDSSVLQIEAPEQQIEEIYNNRRPKNMVNLGDVNQIIMTFMESIEQESSPLNLLIAIKSNDEYTFTHVANVGILTLHQARALGFLGPSLKDIGAAAILHDLGKVDIPNEILNKPGMLSNEERTVMQSHSLNGAKALMSLQGMPKLAILAALEHHIRYDGGGYPVIKEKWQPNIVSQMISVADVFDALRTRRPYRDALPHEKVAEILRKESGTALNPYLVDRFLQSIEH